MDRRTQCVHGISDAILVGKPLFASKSAELLEFPRSSEMVAHNPTFDVGFLENAPRLACTADGLAKHCRVTCSLKLARDRRPGMPNKLDDNRRRLRTPGTCGLHRALEDAHLLAHVVPHLR